MHLHIINTTLINECSPVVIQTTRKFTCKCSSATVHHFGLPVKAPSAYTLSSALVYEGIIFIAIHFFLILTLPDLRMANNNSGIKKYNIFSLSSNPALKLLQKESNYPSKTDFSRFSDLLASHETKPSRYITQNRYPNVTSNPDSMQVRIHNQTVSLYIDTRRPKIHSKTSF